VLIYFSLLGLGFLLIEIPLIQHTILMLGNPTYAFTVVVFALLTFSSIGSLLARSERYPWIAVMGLLIFLAIGSPWLITKSAGFLQQYSFWGRAIIITVFLAPLGVLMGIPFPFGLARLEERWAGLVPWAWAVNGCASVIAAVLAAILNLSYGYQVVLLSGAGAYFLAFLMFPRKWNKTNWA
jgi:hypothetical protein